MTLFSIKNKAHSFTASIKLLFSKREEPVTVTTEVDVPFDPIHWSPPTVRRLQEPICEQDFNSLSDISYYSDDSVVISASLAGLSINSRRTSLNPGSPLTSALKNNRPQSYNFELASSNKSKFSNFLDITFPFEKEYQHCISEEITPENSIASILYSEYSEHSSTTKTLRFNEAVAVYETYSTKDYSRESYSDPEYTDKQVEKINREIRKYKLNEMEVHPQSIHNTSLTV